MAADDGVPRKKSEVAGRFRPPPWAGAEEKALIASAERTGAPDPRVVRIMTRSAAGKAWVKCWNSVLYEGLLPHKLKEMRRIRISVAHRCGYCSTVRSHVARAEGLSEDLVNEVLKEHPGERLLPRERAALEYADLFKSGDDAIDSRADRRRRPAGALAEHSQLGRSLRAEPRAR